MHRVCSPHSSHHSAHALDTHPRPPVCPIQAALSSVDGCSPDFHCGIFFPGDAVIDSCAYARGLLAAAAASGAVRLCQGVTVTSTRTVGDAAVLTLEGASTTTLTAKHCVMATGGLSTHPELSGVLTPEYSYLVHVPPPKGFASHTTYTENSPNFFTLWFSHDWCWTEGSVCYGFCILFFSAVSG